VDEHRFFYDQRQSAQRFAMFAAIFEHDETFLRRVLVPRFLPEKDASDSDEEMCEATNEKGKAKHHQQDGVN
jgi:hypothetical protein